MVVMAKELVLALLAIVEVGVVVIVIIEVGKDDGGVTSTGCIIGGEWRSNGAGEEDVDEPEDIKIGSWWMLFAVVCDTAG